MCRLVWKHRLLLLLLGYLYPAVTESAKPYPRCVDLLHFLPKTSPRAYSVSVSKGWAGFGLTRELLCESGLGDELVPTTLGNRRAVPLRDYLSDNARHGAAQLFFSASVGMQGSRRLLELITNATNEVQHALAQRLRERQVGSFGTRGTGSVVHWHKETWFVLAHGRKLWHLMPLVTTFSFTAQ